MRWAIEATRTTDLQPSEIFAFYADPTTWGAWGHNTRWARSDDPVVAGATVEVKAGYGTVYRVRVREVVPDRRVVCEVRPVGMTVVNTYEVEPSAGGSRIRHAIEVSGPLARPTKLLRFDALYTRWLRREIRSLVELAARHRLSAASASR
jgi:hypothetical protein